LLQIVYKTLFYNVFFRRKVMRGWVV